MSPDEFEIATKIFIIALVLLSTAFHEMAHAFSADYFGDPTPARNGRITFNPIPHLQPVFSAVILPILMFMSSGMLLGMAQTPIDPSRFRHPLRDHALVALAGPLTNMLCAAVMFGALWIPGFWQPDNPTLSMHALYGAGRINLILAVFNMLPLPPLDGYRILRAFVPIKIRMAADDFARNPMSFLVVILIGGWILGKCMVPIQHFVIQLIPR